MSIPKVVHICWFGGSLPDADLQRCEDSRSILTNLGYQIMIWTEQSYDLMASPCTRKAYEEKRWSLVSNYVRLDVLRRYGGFYLDTDVEVVRGFDNLLGEQFVIGFMWDCALGTAVIGAMPGHPIVRAIIDMYDSDPSTLISPNNNTLTTYFLSHVEGFKLNGREQRLPNCTILRKSAFEHPNFLRIGNYTIHHFAQSWKGNSSRKERIKKAVIKLFSLWLYRKYVCWRSLRISPFYPRFLSAVREDAP